MVVARASKVFETEIFVSTKKDSVGLLAKILETFRENNINLSNLRVEFRESLTKPGFLLFFRENVSAPKAKRVLEEIEKINLVEAVRVLGSYPIKKAREKQ